MEAPFTPNKQTLKSHLFTMFGVQMWKWDVKIEEEDLKYNYGILVTRIKSQTSFDWLLYKNIWLLFPKHLNHATVEM